MIYFIFWQIILNIGLDWYYLLLLLIVSLLILPSSQYKSMGYALLVALLLSLLPSPAMNYNQQVIPENSLAYLYHIEGQTADLYLGGQKYKIRNYNLRDFSEGDAVYLREISFYQQKNKNKHGYDLAKHYALWHYRGYLKAKISLAGDAPSDYYPRRIFTAFRRNIEDCFLSLQPHSKNLAKALILGDLSRRDFSQRLSELGIIHLFVVSGFHFTAISMVLLFILQKLWHFPYRLVLIIHSLLLSVYYFSIHSGYGSLRALFVVYFGSLVFITKKRYDLINFSLLYAALNLAWRVEVYQELGFQLTIISVVSVVLLARYLQNYHSFSLTFNNLIISFVVFVIISPLLIYANGSANPLSILIIPLLSPLISIFIILVIIALVFKDLFSFKLFLVGLEFLAKLIIEWIEWASEIKLLKLSYHPYLALIVAIVIIFILVAIIYQNRGLKISYLFAFALCLSAILIINNLEFGSNIHFFALNQGRASFIKGEDMTVLYNSGNDPKLIHYLEKMGISRIDYVIIADDKAYYSGNVDLLKQKFVIGEIISQVEGERIIEQGDTKIRIFKIKDKNNVSYSRGDFSALFLADIPQAELSNYQNKINVLALPTGLSSVQVRELKQRIGAEKVIISGSKKYPRQIAYSDNQSQIYNTAINGEIIIQLRDKAYQLELMR